eukprot:297824-Chlamydomonas_euryale.AAC.2
MPSTPRPHHPGHTDLTPAEAHRPHTSRGTWMSNNSWMLTQISDGQWVSTTSRDDHQSTEEIDRRDDHQSTTSRDDCVEKPELADCRTDAILKEWKAAPAGQICCSEAM